MNLRKLAVLNDETGPLVARLATYKAETENADEVSCFREPEELKRFAERMCRESMAVLGVRVPRTSAGKALLQTVALRVDKWLRDNYGYDFPKGA